MMMQLVRRLAGALVVGAMVSYCCWTDADGGNRFDLKREPAAGRLADLLRLAESVAPHDRDPFERIDHAPALPEPEVEPEEVEPEPGEQTPEAAGGLLPPEADGPPDGGVGENILPELTLHATLIHADRRTAVINGTVCSEGKRLALSDSAAAPLAISRIEADRVWIAQAGRTVILTYDGVEQQPAPTGDVMETKGRRTFAHLIDTLKNLRANLVILTRASGF